VLTAHITVVISKLDVGDVICVSDLALPSSVTTDLDPEEPVVVLTGSTISAEIEAEEAEAAEEAAAAEPGPEGVEGTDEGGGGESARAEG